MVRGQLEGSLRTCGAGDDDDGDHDGRLAKLFCIAYVMMMMIMMAFSKKLTFHRVPYYAPSQFIVHTIFTARGKNLMREG